MILVWSWMFQGQEREWTVVIHRNPLDWPHSFWWHIKQRNPIVYVTHVIGGACSSTCRCSWSIRMVLMKMLQMSLLGLIIRVIVDVVVMWWWFFKSSSTSSSSSNTEIPSQRKLGVSLRREICASWIVCLIIDATTTTGCVVIVVVIAANHIMTALC